MIKYFDIREAIQNNKNIKIKKYSSSACMIIEIIGALGGKIDGEVENFGNGCYMLLSGKAKIKNIEAEIEENLKEEFILV